MNNKFHFDPNIHNRRSIRLQEFDYTQPAAYFITICTYQRENSLGNIEQNQMRLNKFGKIVADHWQHLPGFFSNVKLDEWVIMPNHIHGIILLHSQKNLISGPSPTKKPAVKSGSINAIIQNFKSTSTRKINSLMNQRGVPFWQRNYYEHIIRNDDSLHQIREYIHNNPIQWEMDKLYKE